jgi:succinate dehydrogenase / fumarate reductase membrane anchor subunit
MVNSITSLTGNGLKDWLIQRVSAVYFAGYGLFLFMYFLLHPHLNHAEWQLLTGCIYFKTATVFAMAAFSLHAWVGIWTVITDYLDCTVLRLFFQIAVFSWLFGQFIWMLAIIGRY